uniref:C2H2-type domain-containing protein n=1 Tax=Cacopsylla melanoneura TaxID=428564 RepID=A0A8D8SE04_9HEMI
MKEQEIKANMAKRKHSTVKNISKNMKLKVNETKNKMKQNEKPQTETRLTRGSKKNIEKNNEPNEEEIEIELNDTKGQKIIGVKATKRKPNEETNHAENHGESRKNLGKKQRSDMEKIKINVDTNVKEIKFREISVRKSLYPRTCPECLFTYSTKYSYYKHKKLGRCQRNKSKIQKDISKNTNIWKNKDAKNSNKDEITEILELQIKKLISIESHSQQNIREKLKNQTFEEENESVSMTTQPLHCPVCNHIYKTKATFEKHFFKCKDRKPRNCPNCKKILETDKLYYSHMKGCNRSKVFDDLAMLSSLREEINEENYIDLFPSMKSAAKILDTPFFQCYHCSTMYFSKPTFITHLKKQICGNMKKRISCTYDDCDIKFSRYEHLLLHLPSYHNDTSYLNKSKYFPSYTLFEEWKANEQNETFSYLVKSRGSKVYKSNEYSYYECQFNATGDKKQDPKRKTERRKKAGLIPYLFCPARMSVFRNIPTGIVCVNYIEKHSHELSLENFKYQRFPRAVVNHILSKLKKGVTPLQILEYYQRDIMVSNSHTVNESDIKMNHLITLRFIKYLQKKLQSKEKNLIENTEGSNDGDEELYEVRLCGDNKVYEMTPINKKKPDKILYINCDDENIELEVWKIT